MKNYMLSGLVLLLLMLMMQGAFAQKRIYLAPDDHTDYMWTADDGLLSRPDGCH